jgi:hypothetical protein
MDELRDQLVEVLDRMKTMPVDPEVDSALRLLKAFLQIRDIATRIAFVELAESLARQPSDFRQRDLGRL